MTSAWARKSGSSPGAEKKKATGRWPVPPPRASWPVWEVIGLRQVRAGHRAADHDGHHHGPSGAGLHDSRHGPLAAVPDGRHRGPSAGAADGRLRTPLWRSRRLCWCRSPQIWGVGAGLACPVHHPVRGRPCVPVRPEIPRHGAAHRGVPAVPDRCSVQGRPAAGPIHRAGLPHPGPCNGAADPVRHAAVRGRRAGAWAGLRTLRRGAGAVPDAHRHRLRTARPPERMPSPAVVAGAASGSRPGRRCPVPEAVPGRGWRPP
jgi:hypothetical protein